MNRQILLMVIGLTVISQIVFLYITVRSFERSYLDGVRDNLQAVGRGLQEDLDYILGKGIAIDRLLGLQKLSQSLLADAPTLKAIIIRDMNGQRLYYSDRQAFIRGDGAAAVATPQAAGEVAWNRTDRFENHSAAYTLSFPLMGPGRAPQGTCVLAIDRDHIQTQARTIALDTLTIIVISVLATIDFVFFIVACTITLPIRRAADDIADVRALGFTDRPVRRTGIDFLDRELIRFDRFRQGFAGDLLRLSALGASLRHSREWRPEALPSVEENLRGLQQAFDRFRASELPNGPAVGNGAPALVRPAVFLFVFAEALANSFMPLYAAELYRPLWNLPREIVLGLPISSFMLMSSLTLPFAGALSETIGRQRALMLGALVTGASLVLCATAKDILALIVFRAAVGVGFGLTTISTQGYIIDTSGEESRGEGMAIFLAALYGGSLCGTLIGGLIADRLGFRTLFILGAITALAVLPFALLFLREPSSVRAGVRAGHRLKSLIGNTMAALPSPRDMRRLFGDRDFASLVLFQAIPSKILLIGLVFYCAPLMLKDLGNSQSDIGRYVIGYSLMMALLSQPVSRWCEPKPWTARFVFWGGLFSGLALLPLFTFSGTPVVVSAIFATGLAHTLVISNQDKLVSQSRAIRRLGVGPGLGLYRQSERMGNVIAPLLLAWLTAACGYGPALGILGIYVVLSSLLFRVGYRGERKS